MKAYICWDCGRLCGCKKSFPNGRPKERGECAEFTEAPPEPVRITISEIANTLGVSVRTVFRILATKRGVYRIVHMMSGRGVGLTYERTKYQIHFFREVT